ncbi:acyl-CoA dehydrogenase family protein [Streptomyces sp. NPDC028635]|uniref:acyl-CoA dehydrogenase family protein n=1 Tax=Streptomyces sp. NPDC028635 TaxID=3154800 RepID=UPI0033F7E98C
MRLTAARGTRPGSVSEDSAVRARIAALDKHFGSPGDLSNPLGEAALLRADEEARVPDALPQLLAGYRFGAEFVPTELGGRFVQIDTLCRVVRTVFRHDGALGLATGASTLLAVAPVWAAGRADQQEYVARLLLGGGCPAAVGVGRDCAVADAAPAARRDGERYVLDGHGERCLDAYRSDALLVFARTGAGPAAHSALLLRAGELPDGELRGGPGPRPSFTAHGVPASALVGAEGEGGELARRMRELAGCAVPSMAVGAADGALRTAVGFARDQRLLTHSLVDVPFHRALFAGAFLDLLVADCLALTATRCLHALPGEAGAVAEAAALVVPHLLGRAVDGVAGVLGLAGCVRQGPYAMFGKRRRDLQRLPAAPVTAPAALRAGWAKTRGRSVPRAVFSPGEGLPPLDWRGRPEAVSDPLASSLPAFAADVMGRTDLGPYGRVLGAACAALVDELRDLTRQCAQLHPEQLGVPHPHARHLAQRHGLLLAAVAALGVWREADGHRPGFLADPAWVTAALHRLVVRLGREIPAPPATTEREVVAELLARHRSHRTFDVYDTPLAG